MPGLDRILKGVLKYTKNLRPSMVHQFELIRDNPQPKAVMFSCMDSRIIITRLLQADVGDMFLVRNAGNLIPDSCTLSDSTVTTEGAALELGCVINKIQHIFVCGHSDCKAMNALFTIRDQLDVETPSPLQSWLRRCGKPSVNKLNTFLKTDELEPIEFNSESGIFQANIDVEKKFSIVDRFSMINTLQQIEHIAGYPILKNTFKNGKLKIHAIWFDVYTGNFYMFSRAKKTFILINEENYYHLLQDQDS